jgi:hypothetical protein
MHHALVTTAEAKREHLSEIGAKKLRSYLTFEILRER